jgi:hypothetical protein
MHRVLPTAQDRETFNTLAAQIATGSLMAFVGAGMSARAGFGDWEGLLDSLRQQAEIVNQMKLVPEDTRQRLRRRNQQPVKVDVDDMSWLAEEIRGRFRRPAKYLSILRSHFGRDPGSPDEAIRAFAKLPFTHVFTTNYDLSLERALREAQRSCKPRNWRRNGVPGDVMRSIATNAGATRYLVYLHGRGREPATIVLSERDYRDMYIRSDETVRKLFAIFSLRSAVFFGFSLRDLDVLNIFRQVKASVDGTFHFALMPDRDHVGRPLTGESRESLRNRYAAKFGVASIFFRPGTNFQNFEWCMVRLADLVNAPKPEGRRVETGDETKRSTARVPARRRRERRFASGLWTRTRDFKEMRGVADPDDPQKGRFGGSPRCNGRGLTAVVTESSETRGWFDVELVIQATRGHPLRGKVDLWVHDSFPSEHYHTVSRRGVARFSFSAYGSFTVGAVCDGGRTPLELDLSELRDAPERFRRS